MLKQVLLVTTLLYCIQAERNVATDVQVFVSKFNEFNETMDVLGNLERIGEHSRELFRQGRLVGQMLAHFNSTGEISADESGAWDELLKLIHLDSVDYSYDGMYSYLVSSQIKRRFFMLEIMLADTAASGGHISIMLTEQRGLLSPMTLLTRHPVNAPYNFTSMDQFVRLDCSMPKADEISKIVRMHDAFQRLETRIHDKYFGQDTQRQACSDCLYSYESYKSVFLSTSMRVPEEDVNSMVKSLDELTSPSYNTTANMMRQKEQDENKDKLIFFQDLRCRQEEIYAEFAFNQTVKLSKLRNVHTDLLRIVLLEVLMSSGSGLPEELYNEQAEKAILSIERTGHYIAQWSRTFEALFEENRRHSPHMLLTNDN